MTIKALKKYLFDKHPKLFRKINIYTFHKCKIAIDASGLGHNYWYPCQKGVVDQLVDPTQELDIAKMIGFWLNNIWKLLSKLLRLGITPILVFDGTPPLEKEKVIKERQEDKRLAKAAIDSYINEMKQLDSIQRNRSHLAHMKNLYGKWKALNWEHFELLKIFIQGLGLPVVDAVNEAEELCAELVRSGLASASYCEDVDSLAHLAPIWIFDKSSTKEFVPERKEYIESFEYIILDEVLAALQMTKETFVDFCIMCGCDYNTNIYNVGPDKSYKLLKQYNNIDNIMDNKANISIFKDTKTKQYKNLDILNYQVCRRLFSKRDYTTCCIKPDYQLEIDFNCINEYSLLYLQKCEMEHLVNDLDFIYAAFPRENGLIDINKLKYDILEPEPPKEFLDTNKIDISNIDVNNIDISKINVNNIDISKINVNNIDISKINVNNIDISNINVNNIDIGKINVSNIDTSKINVSNIDNNFQIVNNIPLNIDISKIDLSMFKL